MNVFYFLPQEFRGVDVLCLNILPDAMLVSLVASPLLKQIEELFLILGSQILQNFVCCERAELLSNFSN